MYTADMRISKVDKKIRSRAQHTYVLADSSKIDKTALACHGFIQQVDALITDDGLSDENKQRLTQLGAQVIVVPTTNRS